MRDGSWANGPVQKVGATVMVSGTPLEADSVRVTREWAQGFPGQSRAAGGMTAATGRVEWSGSAVTSSQTDTPWTMRDMPTRGQPVTVALNDGTNSHAVFTGITDGTSGSYASPGRVTELIDRVDQLNTAYSAPALCRTMPPIATDNSTHRRMLGLYPTFITDCLFRAAGFYATPPMDGYCAVSAPLTGSTWPERGTLLKSYRADDVEGWNKYHPAAVVRPTHLAMSDMYAEYATDSAWSYPITAQRPLNITLSAGFGQVTSSYVSATWPGPLQMRLSVTSSRSLVLQTINAAGDVITRLTMTEGQAGGAWETATVRVESLSATSFRATVKTNLGVSKSADFGKPVGMSTSDVVTGMRVFAPAGTSLSSAQVSFTSVPQYACEWNRSAVIEDATPPRPLTAVPAIESEQVIDLLKEQAEAVGAALWIDEDGLLRWRHRTRITTGAVVRTLTAAEDLLDVRWAVDAADVRRKITVKNRVAAASIAKSSRLICYEGPRSEVIPGDTHEVLITPGADEDWIAVDSTPNAIFGGDGALQFNRGQGSWVGYTCLDDDGDEFSSITYDEKKWSFKRIGPASWHYILELESLPKGVDRVTTSTRSEDSSSLKRKYQGLGLPLLRCMGLITWADNEYTPGVTGPEWAAELNHDVGWHVQDPGEVQALGQWLAAELAAPHPVIETVRIIPDPRIQLGDKVMIEDPVRTGVTLTGVVAGVEPDVATGGAPEMSLRLMLTAASTPLVTLRQFDAFYPTDSLGSNDTRFANQTLGQRDANPLIR